MANFKQAFQLVLQNEGSYVNDPQDAGGETYKGIARKMNPKWLGWAIVDAQKKKANFPANLATNKKLNSEIENFYKTNYWDKIKGDLIIEQSIANSIFDFAVNAGVGTSIKLAQAVVKTKADGIIGNMTLKAINSNFPETFLALFTIAKINRYINIVESKPSNSKFFYGWVRRAVGK